MMLSFLLCAVVGAFLWLDRVYIFQSMLGRPIVLSPVLGLIMGDMTVGFIVGAALELLWLNAPPVGAYLPNDETFCAAAVTPAAVVAATSIGNTAAAGLLLVMGLPFSLAGRAIDTRLRALNQNLLPDFPADVGKAVDTAMTKALGRAYLSILIGLGVCIGVLSTAAYLIAPRLPGAVVTALGYMPSASIVIGLAGLINRDVFKTGKVALFILGMAILLIFTWIR